jgi:F-type H+-transporting ATPase subunit delta
MLDRSAAKRYANALFELAREQKIDAEVESALAELSGALKGSVQAERLLMNPRLDLAEKRRMFTRILAGSGGPAGELLLNFFSVLFEKSRFNLVHEVAAEYKIIADQAQGESIAVVRTAQPLDPASEAKLTAVLEKRTGTKVFLKKEVDASVLGGVEVRIGNRVIDGTIRGGIARMRGELLKRQ